MKVTLPPQTFVFPLPVLLVSSANQDGSPNIITVAWAGTLCSKPPMIGVSIRPERHSNRLMRDAGDFCVNIVDADILEKADLCGNVSGKDVDKFERAGLTPGTARHVKAPLILECPVNIECVTRHVIPLGTHDLFIGEVLQIHVDEEKLDRKGRLDTAKLSMVSYVMDEYWQLDRKLADAGYSKTT